MSGLLVLALAWTVAAEASIARDWFNRPPLGLDIHMPVPVTNLLTREKVEQGRRLFFDTRLSRDGTVACASCHDPKQAFADGRALARGIGGAEGTRNASALINRGYGRSGFWDGRAETLEQQVLEPILNPKELGLTEETLVARTGMGVSSVTAALASYIRTIRSGDSRFDRFAAGRDNALNVVEKKGLQVFRGKGRCADCHIGPSFTDERFHNTGVAWRPSTSSGQVMGPGDLGRAGVTGADADRGAFKTPTLREVSRTAPYMHDGSLTTLEEVVEFYSVGGRKNPSLDPLIQPRDFTSDDKQALVAFLKSLTGHVHEGVR